MNPATILERARTDGVSLILSPAGTLKATGEQEVVSRWLPVIREHKAGIVAALQDAANDSMPGLGATPVGAGTETVVSAATTPAATVPDTFSFSPPGDPANDDEALQERVAIMMEGNGWDAATALQEARWQADKERCWRRFLSNAQRVLEAPAHKREALLTLYQVEAARQYGQAAGANMAGGLSAWVKARGVH